jgi:hypothetical protein
MPFTAQLPIGPHDLSAVVQFGRDVHQARSVQHAAQTILPDLLGCNTVYLSDSIGILDVISQKIELFTVTAMRNSNSIVFLEFSFHMENATLL